MRQIATQMEGVVILGASVGSSIAALCDDYERLKEREFERDTAEEFLSAFEYPALAMRTAAGPEVFHWPPMNMPTGGDPKQLDEAANRVFRGDVVSFLRAADALNRWKSMLFYKKDPNADGFHRYFAELDQFDVDRVNPQLIHAALGIASEAGELLYNVAEALGGAELDPNINCESGDIDWFQELLAHVTGQSTDENRRQNIDRLAKRFPEKFSEAAAVERADEP